MIARAAGTHREYYELCQSEKSTMVQVDGAHREYPLTFTSPRYTKQSKAKKNHGGEVPREVRERPDKGPRRSESVQDAVHLKIAYV